MEYEKSLFEHTYIVVVELRAQKLLRRTAMQQSSFDTIKYQFPLFEKCLLNAFFNYEKSIVAYREKPFITVFYFCMGRLPQYCVMLWISGTNLSTKLVPKASFVEDYKCNKGRRALLWQKLLYETNFPGGCVQCMCNIILWAECIIKLTQNLSSKCTFFYSLVVFFIKVYLRMLFLCSSSCLLTSHVWKKFPHQESQGKGPK